MKPYALVVALLLAASSLSAQAPFQASSEHYKVESHVSQEQADLLLKQMESLLAKYNSFFLFDLSILPAPFSLTVFADKAGFDEFLKDKIPLGRNDFVYLHYKDPAKRILAAYAGPEDSFQALAFQGFIQFLWNYVPTAPAWVRNGFAYYFWDFSWNSETQTLVSPQNFSFLESLKAEIAKGALEVQPLLTLDETAKTMSPSQDYLSWGIIHFLLNTDNQSYSRLMGNVLANIKPSESQDANSKAILTRFQNTRPLNEFSQDLSTFISSIEDYAGLMEQGVELFKKKELGLAQVLFTKAKSLKPQEFFPDYYLGLVAYESKDYEIAESHYAMAENKNGEPAGLLAFARGLNSFYLKDAEGTKSYLAKAIEQNNELFGVQSLKVLELVQ